MHKTVVKLQYFDTFAYPLKVNDSTFIQKLNKLYYVCTGSFFAK